MSTEPAPPLPPSLDEVEDAMEVVGPRKPTFALPLPLPRPSVVDRQRTGGLFPSYLFRAARLWEGESF